MVTAPVRAVWPADTVDSWGRDPQLQQITLGLARLRWQLTIGGDHHVRRDRPALLVANCRSWSMIGPVAALALADVLDRPVRFLGRPDIAPVGPMMRRLGGILADESELAGALNDGDAVLMTTAPTAHPRHAGVVRTDFVGIAAQMSVPVHGVATLYTRLGRSVRLEVGSAVRPRRVRRGPLGDVELADATQRSVQTMLDSMGGMGTGLTAVDWIN
jgi:hypothetical protein